MSARDVPIFREEDGHWRGDPYAPNVLTTAAPNLQGMGDAEREALRPVAQHALEQRASRVLTLFRHERCTRVVLGAWGCGAFRNDPKHVASTFANLLRGPHAGAFDEVVFAVFAMPWEETNLQAFQGAFA